jgi:SOS response regulatory protein OraA/RecX
LKRLKKRLKNNLSKALAYCSKNIRCKSEVVYKIKTWNLDSEEEANIIEFLDLHNFFFSDDSFIDKYLENISSVKGYSKIQLKIKLLKKHISPKLIDIKLNEYFKDNEEFELEKFIKRNSRKLKSKPREEAIKYLLSKGFKYNHITKNIEIHNL